MLPLQLGLLLAYQGLIFSLQHFYPEMDFVRAELLALAAHALILLTLSFFYFRKKETDKAIGMLLPFFIVLLIGLGGCFNERYPHHSESHDRKRRQDSIRKADSIRRLDEKTVLPEQSLR